MSKKTNNEENQAVSPKPLPLGGASCSASYTPGPWIVDPWTAHVNEVATGLPLVAMQWPSDDRNEDTTKANARLIAAAPEMLEALNAVVSGWENPEMGWLADNKVRAAIAKASLPNVKEHAPLSARASVDHGVEAVKYGRECKQSG